MSYAVRKTGWIGGGVTKKLVLTEDANAGGEGVLSRAQHVLTVRVGRGLPADTRTYLLIH